MKALLRVKPQHHFSWHTFFVCSVHWSYFLSELLKLNSITCPFSQINTTLHDETTIHSTIKILPFTINCTISNTSGAKGLFGRNLKTKTWLSTSLIGFRVNLTWPGDFWFQLPKQRPLYWGTFGLRCPFLSRTNRVTFRAFLSPYFVPHSTRRKSPV